ncbi:MAG: hypothetical protein CL902_00525 [Dehalococcoidia bacterium]|nr:hypothetical protein [Dehalococcoidia bacterium]
MRGVNCDARRLGFLAKDLAGLTFAKVTRVVLKPENITQGADDTAVYKYFYGFSQMLGHGTTVFFKSSTYCRKLFVGPLCLHRDMKVRSQYPVRGDIIMGEMANDDGRRVFVWWTHGMRPMYQFRERIFGKIRCRRLTNRIRDEMRFDPAAFPERSSDALWALFCLVAFHDIGALDGIAPEDKPRFLWLTAAWIRDPLFFERAGVENDRYSNKNLKSFLAYTAEK